MRKVLSHQNPLVESNPEKVSNCAEYTLLHVFKTCETQCGYSSHQPLFYLKAAITGCEGDDS